MMFFQRFTISSISVLILQITHGQDYEGLTLGASGKPTKRGILVIALVIQEIKYGRGNTEVMLLELRE